MRKLTFRGLALAMVVLFLAACQSQPAKTTQPPPAQPAQAQPTQPAQTQTQTQTAAPATKGIQPAGDVKPNPATDPVKKDVDAGRLPPLDRRLPEKPMAIGVREAIGTYGGTINTYHFGADGGMLKMWLYDPPVRWKEDYTGFEPGLAEKWEFTDDGKTVTFTFRKGVKWSDGQPFTTADLVFWWEDLANVKDSGYSPPWWSRHKDGSTMQVKALNENQIQFIFKEPNWNVPYVLAQGFWEWDALMKPKHFLSKFHPKYNPEHKDFVKLREMDDYIRTPGYPTLYGWVTTDYKAGERIVLERNPYYWKIDPQGNQLPYVDKIVSVELQDDQVAVLKALKGEFDLTVRRMHPKNISTLKKNEDRGNYRVVLWTNGAGGWPGMLVNQDYVGDAYIRDLLRNKKFRQALSLAIDRENVNEAVWSGMGVVQQGTVSKESWHFQDEAGKNLFRQWQQSYAKYDPDAANKLLDEVGLNRKDAHGFRLRPDGKPFELWIDVTDWGSRPVNAETASLLIKDFGNVGIKVQLKDVQDAETGPRFDSAEWMLSFAHAAEIDLWTYPDWVFTVRGNRAWPLQGRWYESGGEKGEKPFDGSPAQKLNELYHKGLGVKDIAARHPIVHEAVRLLLDEGPFYIGITGGIPEPVIARKTLKNLAEVGVLGPWAPGTPGNTNFTTLFFAK